MKKYAAASLLFSFLLIAGTLFGQSKPVTIDSMIKRTNRLGLFSGNILVVDGGKVVYRNAIGFTDASKTEKLTDNYRFHIGSIAKEFNAVGIMMLQEQGKLNIDDKLSKFFPELPEWANTISIKNLLQYTSGLPDVKWKTVTGDNSNMADIMKISQLDFAPGTKYNYNNNNVFMQRRIIEKVTGMPFNKFVDEKLLKPAGMKTAVIDPDNNTPLMAKSYTNEGKQGSMFYPITGWVAVTLDDFYKWEQALENFKLIGPASTAVLVTPFAPGKQCGLGGGTMAGNKLVFHKHDGISIYYQALLVGSPLKGRTVILMTNNKQDNIFDIDNAIENISRRQTLRPAKTVDPGRFPKTFRHLSGPQVLAFYHDLKAKRPNEYGFESETTLNEIGYSLMGAKNMEAAIIVFEYNTKLFPTSGNVFDSLGEAYYNKGDKGKALLNYKRSSQLDPTNGNARDVVKELEKK